MDNRHSKHFKTESELDVFTALAKTQAEERHRYAAPRLIDVAEAAGRSTAWTHEVLVQLHEKGAVYYPKGERRVLRITDEWMRLANALRKAAEL